MKSLGSLLRDSSLQSNVIRGVTAARVVELASQELVSLFGEQIKDFAQAAYYKNKALTFACLSPTVAQEIKLQDKRIIEHINKQLGFNAVQKVTYIM